LASIVIKSNGQEQAFDINKLTNSLQACLISSGLDKKSIEKDAAEIAKSFIKWLGNKNHVSSDEIRKTAAKLIASYSPEASFLYQHHRNLK
jgi:transcriptional regulator NrdR family protein